MGAPHRGTRGAGTRRARPATQRGAAPARRARRPPRRRPCPSCANGRARGAAEAAPPKPVDAPPPSQAAEPAAAEAARRAPDAPATPAPGEPADADRRAGGEPAARRAATLAEPTVAPTADGDAPGDDLERLRRGWTEVVAIVSERNRAAQAADHRLPPDRRRGRRRHPRLPGGAGLPARTSRSAARPLLEEGIRRYLGRDVGVRCVATNLDLLPPLPADAEAAHILAEAHRIFADDLADVPEVT